MVTQHSTPSSSEEDPSERRLPPHLELQRLRVLCDDDAPKFTQSSQYSGFYASSGIDNSLNLEKFESNLKIEVIALKEDFMEFDMIGIDAAIANAFRRILIAEVPTMAIENVYMMMNTSVIQDEVLSHRLGLVPLKVDPRLFEYKSPEDTAGEKNTLVFKLHVKCHREGNRLVNSSVLSGALEWLPRGSNWPENAPKKFTAFGNDQGEVLGLTNQPPKPFYEDIVLAKLRPGEEIELEAHAIKGVGKTHAKWSPVCTTAYRMRPDIIFLKEIKDELAEKIVRACPVNVFDIEDLGKEGKRARVANPRKCTLCRECIRHEDWDQYIQLHRLKNHFIFTIESSGALPPDVLFTEAVKILKSKANTIALELTKQSLF